MPLHIDDYLGDTDHLTASEHGAYLLLIMKYWRDGGLPADEGMIRRFAKLSPEQWIESRNVIAAFFDADWKHARIDAELLKADEIIEKRRNAASARHEKSKCSASAEQMDCTSSDTRVPPLTGNLEPGLLPQSLEGTPEARPRKRATQIPDDFRPSEVVLHDHQIDVLTSDEVFRQVERMIDWAKSKGETRKDWNAFARGWLRKEADLKREREAKRNANGYNTRDSITQAFDYIDRRDARRSQDGSQENPQLLPGLRQAST